MATTPEQISLGIAILGFIATGIASLIGGIAVGSWWVSGKNKDIELHGTAITDIGTAISAINERCEKQKKEILDELERRVCNGFKVAVKDLELRYLDRLGEVKEEVAGLTQRMNGAERDIEEILKRINLRASDRG